MARILFIFLLIFALALTGCTNNYSTQFNATSDSDCTVKCADFSQHKICLQYNPSYSDSTQYLNNKIQNKTSKCDCASLECFR